MSVLDTKFRYDSIDQLRGLVIVLMALDHVRDFWSPYPFMPEDLSQTFPLLFATRWVTHFCAPVFIFLTGMSTYLFESKGNSRSTVRNFLLTRGIWLVFIEFTIVNLSWKFNFEPWMFGQVIWAIGMCMLALAVFIYLPRLVTLIIGLAMIVGHNLLDGIQADSFGAYAWVWAMLHEPKFVPIFDTGVGMFFAYPLIPWIGLMAVGYASASWFFKDPAGFSQKCIRTGVIITIAFIALRWTNWYGDPGIWEVQDRGGIFTLISFLNLQKYPPSLLYLLMTMGPALVLLGFLHQHQYKLAQPLTMFGRVPFFFYVLHMPFLHGLALLYFMITIGASGANWQMQGPQAFPPGYVPNIWLCYIAFAFVIFVMYFACRWFSGVKKRHSHWVLKYL